MNITWGESDSAPVAAGESGVTLDRPRKLKKKVSFAPAHPLPPDTPPPPKSPKSSGLTKLKNPFRIFSEPAQSTKLAGGPPSPTASDGSAASWHHHESYFPEYEPMFPSSTTAGKEWISPFETMLTPEEIRRQHHAAVLGSAVAVHYPDLPSWAEYTAGAGGDKDKSKAGWQTGKWGTEGWSGYGWDGEVLPLPDGTTFGAPMPVGVEIKPPEPAKKKKKKKKKGGGGGGGGDGGGGGEGDEDGADDGDEGAGDDE